MTKSRHGTNFVFSNFTSVFIIFSFLIIEKGKKEETNEVFVWVVVGFILLLYEYK